MADENICAVKLVVADLAGTTVDYGSRAPAGGFIELFDRHGVAITEAEAREPMGTQKRDHIAALLGMPRIFAAWKEKHGTEPEDRSIDALYEEFIPLQVEILPHYGDLISGTLDAVKTIKECGVRVAVTTGYNREMLEVVLESAAAQGFKPDASFCAEDVPAGRPAPWMIYRCMEALNIFPPAAVVSVGDTIPDVASARNAGVWSIGVTLTGNMVGLPAAEASALPDSERARRLKIAAETMEEAGAHMVIDGVHELAQCVETINARLAKGERP